MIGVDSRSIFTSFLEQLNVRHTAKFSSKRYNEHPHKYNLFGLSSMLSEYGIENVGFRVEDKDSGLLQFEAPFIAHVDNEFVIVDRLSAERIRYIWNNKEITISTDEFKSIWSGIVLLAEENEQSIEPGYKENRKKEILDNLQQYILLSAICMVLILACIHNGVFTQPGILLSLLIHLAGIFVTYLLIVKQSHSQSSYADKICSLFKQGDCNNVLDSDASKLMGVISWSEIGLGYFISNTILFVFTPFLIGYSAILNLFTLPYSIWSIWYQKVKAKQWCSLCVLVQALLWCIFAINLAFGYIRWPEIDAMYILWAGCIYLIPMLTIHLILPFVSNANRVERITQEMNSLKLNEDVFTVQLKKQPYYKVDKSASKIKFGNPNANALITIFTNPHCEPCAKMHARMENVLKDSKGRFCIQYMLSSFSEELESSSEFLIQSYLNNPYEKAVAIYHEWFEGGKYQRKEFFQKYTMEQTAKGEEYAAHKKWKEESQIRATPTILINGYKLPDNYTIEDLRFMTEFDVDIK